MDPAQCRGCHPEHVDEWASSMHAYASDDPVFLALNRLGQRATGGALGTFCVGCHAPAALAVGVTRDGTDLDQVPRYLRGVTCWGCHAITEVSELHNGSVQRANDAIMRGGIADAVATPAHGSQRTGLLAGDRPESSAACGACHDVRLGNGVLVESTYAEWAGSVFATGGALPVSCASCHMFGRDGVAAALPGMPARRLHDHRFAAIDEALVPWPGKEGQAERIQRDLNAALSSKLCVVAAPGGASVEVTLDNVQVGHAFPSGVTHARRVWVELTASREGVILFATGRFGDGEPVTTAADPGLWLLSSRFVDGRGDDVTHVWDAVGLVSTLLGPSVTVDPNDPRYYHAQTRTWPVSGIPDRVDLAVNVEAIGLEILDSLIDEGELDPALRAAMPRRRIDALSRTWIGAEGSACAP